ncbi:unnamed protein product [Hermetia illucens]|uniref:Envelope protein n=1 Tax=Hermetia illucens TaxID=343691 RepID=A0A7R8UYR4_HERIL|nr:unnamed protein product [Hermetia illucens]
MNPALVVLMFIAAVKVGRCSDVIDEEWKALEKTPTTGLLNVFDINEQGGFMILHSDKVDIVSRSSLVVHIVNTTEILELLNNFKINVDRLDRGHKELLLNELKNLRHKVKTIIPNASREKRGLMNFVGDVSSWLFGTLTENDKQNIEKSLKRIDSNTHNAIKTINEQVIINSKFNETIYQLKNIIKSDREKLASKIDSIERSSMSNNLYYDQLFAIQTLKARIEHLQDNIVSAKYGILHPNILTDEEIQEFKIDFVKIQHIKLGVTKFQDNLLLFAIKIPNEYIKVQLKIIIPIPNSQKKEIDSPIETIFEYNEIVYKYEPMKSLNELRRTNHCIYRKNCQMTKLNTTEVLGIDDQTIIVKNANYVNINQSCDERKLLIKNNALIHFNGCQIKVLDYYFSNVEQKFKERFFYPTRGNYENFTDKITFDDIIIDNAENIEKIKELQDNGWINYGIDISLAIISYLRNPGLTQDKDYDGAVSEGGGIVQQPEGPAEREYLDGGESIPIIKEGRAPENSKGAISKEQNLKEVAKQRDDIVSDEEFICFDSAQGSVKPNHDTERLCDNYDRKSDFRGEYSLRGARNDHSRARGYQHYDGIENGSYGLWSKLRNIVSDCIF